MILNMLVVFFSITKKMIFERMIVEDAKTLLLSHDNRIEIRRQANILSLPSVNLSVVTSSNINQYVVQYS